MNTEKLREKFLASDACLMCGTQRCERTEEWMEGCPKWLDFKRIAKTKG